MSCCDGCIKYLLFVFNLLFSLTGLALIVTGAVLISNTSGFSDLYSDIEDNQKVSQIVIIIVGVIIFFIATLGCCGAIRENRCMLITFAILLLSIFIIQLAIGIYALTHKENIKETMHKGLAKQFQKMQTDNNVANLFHKMEYDMECCGVDGPQDYISKITAVPATCCSDKNECKTKPFGYFPTGCAVALANFAGKAGNVIGAIAISLSAIEVLGAIFALRLASKVR